MLTKAIAGALLSMILTAQTQAQEIDVGSGIFCDTQAQMERFVTLFEGDAQMAINAVNAEVHNPTACVAATIAFVRGPEVGKRATWNETIHIVQVTVIGVMTPTGPRAIDPTIIYSIKRVEERGA